MAKFTGRILGPMAAGLLLLVGLIVGTAWGLVRAERERIRAEEANAIAREQGLIARLELQRARAEDREQQAINAVKRTSAAVANSPDSKNNPGYAGRDGAIGDGQGPIERRRRVLKWLQAELAAWSDVLTVSDPDGRKRIAEALSRWRRDDDLASVRDPAALENLPESERIIWKAFWADLEPLLANAREG